ncbi:MAG: DUF92 domain-containing protein [Chloroflexota bacterium]|nr:DUF92 domain-containing protein [Chloroflexota bacterium]
MLGLLFSGAVSLLAYRRRSLSGSGVPGAMVTGATIVGLGGWDWGLALVFFFVSSSLFSHFREREKARTAADKFSKGSQRDLLQVAANGGVATLAALGYGLVGQRQATRELFLAGFTGALATATADTWATELGVLSPQQPRLLTSGQRVAPGTSGGITPLGTGAAALGALAQGSVFQLTRLRQSRHARGAGRFLPLIALTSGLAGSLFDSLLGATVQAIYYCPTCHKETEWRIHNCGTRTTPLRGLSWLNNDVVNFLATLFGGLVAMVTTQLLASASRRGDKNCV